MLYPVLAFLAGLIVAVAVGAWAFRAYRRRRAGDAEAARMAEANRWFEVLDLGTDAVFVIDHASGAGIASKALAGFLGLDGAAGFKDVRDRLPPEAGKRLGAAVAALRRDGKPFELDLVFDDRPLGIVGTRTGGADVVQFRPKSPRTPLTPPTALPKPAPGARDGVLDLLSTAVALFSADQRLVYANPAYARLWRLDPDWIATGPTFGEIMDRQRQARRLPEVADFRAFRQAQVALFAAPELPPPDLMHLPDGSTIKVTMARLGAGGISFVFEDVSDRLALERNLKTLSAVQGETIERLQEGVAVFGADGRLKLANGAFARLWHLNDAAMTDALHLRDFVDAMRPFAEDSEGWPAQRDDLIGVLMERRSRNGKLHRADGSVLQYANVPLPDGAVLLSYLDVTDGVRVERALRERAEALEDASRQKSKFIADVSYEIRTPLNSAIGFAEVLAGGYFGELNRRQAEYVEGIVGSSRALMTVIGDILDLASIEAGQLELENDSVDIHAMLVAVLNLVKERARRKSLHLQFDCPHDIGWLIGDERRLRQALLHLLVNAIAFTPDRGGVRLTAERQTDQVAIAVADTGVGIPLADQARILKPFERGANKRRPDDGAGDGGAGLGLALVQSLIAMHGGSLDLKSTPNKGTTVTLRLKASGASAKDAFQA